MEKDREAFAELLTALCLNKLDEESTSVVYSLKFNSERESKFSVDICNLNDDGDKDLPCTVKDSWNFPWLESGDNECAIAKF